MTAKQLYVEATKRGLRLEPRGDKLGVIPANRCPPDFAAELRQHKAELMALLQAKAANLPTDCAAWLHIARQVLQREFDGADRSMRESLTIGLRATNHPSCQQALERLSANAKERRE
ncbi:MAG: hypothetical protein ABSC18_01970 [Verrucomicrobiota bacterium]|jgi:hypothetical protein